MQFGVQHLLTEFICHPSCIYFTENQLGDFGLVLLSQPNPSQRVVVQQIQGRLFGVFALSSYL